MASLSYGNYNDLRTSIDTTMTAFEISEAGVSGLFVYDSTDTTSADDSAMVIIQAAGGNRRFKRQYADVIDPKWFGAKGDGVTNDTASITSAANYAASKNDTFSLPEGNYIVSSNVLFQCNVTGFGTFLTRSGAKIIVQKAGGTVENISINGLSAGVIDGGSLACQYAANMTVQNVKISNTLGSAGIYASYTDYIRILGNTINTTRDTYGDSIYVNHSLSPTVANNVCIDFQRIGISIEQHSYNPQIIGNVVKKAFPSIGGQINAGIWAETVYGGEISLNYIEDSLSKGIVAHPGPAVAPCYSWSIIGNTVVNALECVNVPYATDQIYIIADNNFVDITNGIQVGDCFQTTILNNTWSLRNKLVTAIGALIRYEPTKDLSKISNLTIDSCTNNIGVGGTYMPIVFPNVSGFRGNLIVRNCTGNFAFSKQNAQYVGDFNLENCELDFTNITSGISYLANTTGDVRYKGCDILLNSSVSLRVQSASFELFDCSIRSNALASITIGSYGSENLRFEGCKFDSVVIYSIVKATTKIILRDCEITNYDSIGFLTGVLPNLAALEIRGNKFVSNVAYTPIQLPNQSNVTIGVNVYYSVALYSGFTPVAVAINNARGTTAARPATNQEMYQYFDTTLNRWIYWNGTQWIVPPSYITNAATSAPASKAALNALYGASSAGSVITYPSITTGARDYFKLSDSSTSDWVQTAWSSGLKVLMP